MPTGTYLYLARQLANYMVRFNFPVGPVRTQITNMQKMNISDMSTQKIPNLRVYSSAESKS